MVVGWATSARIDTDLVSLALQMAICKRQPPPGLLLHSDRGVQYTSEVYRRLVRKHGIIQSMSRLGNCWDNAVAESFFRTLKVETIYGCSIQTRTEAKRKIFDFIHGFYNSKRMHSFLLYNSPESWEVQVSLDPGLLTRRQNFLK
jgi:transposase InsO family protein